MLLFLVTDIAFVSVNDLQWQIVWQPLFVERKMSHVNLAATSKFGGRNPVDDSSVTDERQISIVQRRNVIVDAAINSNAIK